jgi:hypothetical protein
VHVHALGVAVDAGACGDRRLDEPLLPQRANAVGQPYGEGTARHLNVGDAETLAQPRAHRDDLAVERAADDRQAVEPVRERVAFLGVAPGRLERRVGELHHVRAVLGDEAEPAGQVRVEDVEAARAERQLARLDVDEDVVVELDRARQSWIGDARGAVDLEPHESFVSLDDRGDASASKAERHPGQRRSDRG